MTRLSKILIAAAAMFAAPVSTAFAQDAEPAEGEAGAEVGAEGSVDASGTATVDGAAPVDSVQAAVTVGAWPSSIIDRPLTLMKGKLGTQADVFIAHVSLLGTSATSEGLALGAGYGVSDKLTVGGTYAFALNEFEIKGPLTIYGGFNLTDNGKLSVAAGADIEADFGGSDGMGGSSTDVAIHAGLAVRYKVAPKIAVYTGNPYSPGPSGQHLTLGLSEGASKSFAIPVGVAIQATPQLYASIDTRLATILLSDPGMGDRVAFIGSDAGGIPLAVSGWFNVNKNIDAGASLNFPDLNFAGDFYLISFGARYYN